MGQILEGDFTTLGEFEALVDQRLSDVHSDAESLILVGMLFMREGQTLADKEILPSLDYFDKRSGDSIDFYLPGWRCDWNNPLGDRGNPKWTFHLDMFLKAQGAMESETNWRYSGGVDLLLMTAGKDVKSTSLSTGHSHERRKYTIDLTGVISIPVHTLVKSNLIESPEILFERVFRFAKVFKGGDPLLGLMGQEVRVSAIEAIIESVFGLLPKEAKQRLDYSKHFSIKDVSKDGRRKTAVIKINNDFIPYPS
jgi:hypothetical protein